MSTEHEPHLPHDESELKLGGTERGAAANGVILALTRAARSFLLYDPSNEAIRHFLGALKDAVEGYLGTHGDLPLVVRPFELVVHGEVVYLDRDRERSLAFRLYRDGIRKITLNVGLEWHELLKLLEVLSIRYTGVRQTEDDMVVLLWKAGFTHIQLEAIEGFVPEEEEGDPGAVAAAGPVHAHVEVPADFDLPPPALGPPGPLYHRELSQAELAAVLDEDSLQALPPLTLRLATELLRAAGDPTDPMTFTEIVPQLREIRDFLLAEGLLHTVLALVRVLAGTFLAREAEQHERTVLLASFGDERAIGRLLHSVPRDATAAPPDMVELLDQLPGNHLKMILAVLETEHGEASRRVARSLIERYVPRHGEWIVAQMSTLAPAVAVELLRSLAAADMNRAIEALGPIGGRGELELHLEALHVLDAAPATAPAVPRLVLAYASNPNEEVRIRALEVIAKKSLKAAFGPVSERVKREAPLRLGHREAEMAGYALARADGPRAMELFREWLKPRGLFSGILPGQTMLQWVGVAGLVYLPGDEPEQLVKKASERAGSELAQHCTASLVKRRRLLRGA